MAERTAARHWFVAFAIAFTLLLMLLYSLAVLLAQGVGIWGINVPVGWGFAIINFVWWIGIAHAGTLISAILLLLRQEWRVSVHRFAESMTLFAIACAALFPLIHMGRPWLFYWLLPYPSTSGAWPQFRSPLVWDVFAIATYAIVSLAFWYLGLLPDLAVLRDRATSRRAQVTWCLLAMGWRGSARQWASHRTAYLLLAGLATPLVISVHSVVSFNFAVSIVPGWHSTIFPPYFVAGAIFSGFAMLLALAIPLRAIYRLEALITVRHLENMGKVLLAAGLIVAYGYVSEAFFAWYGGNRYEQYTFLNRLTGPYAPLFWALLAANGGAPQLLWSARVRRSPVMLFAIAIAVSAGMWLERFVIVVTSLHRDYLPSAWGMYWPTAWDWATLVGSAGLFLCLLLLFVRFLPVVPIVETRSETTLPEIAPPPPVPASKPSSLYGFLAEFRNPGHLLEAARRARQEGYRRLDAYSPAPIDGLEEVFGGSRRRLAGLVLAGGALGAAIGFGVQYWTAVIDMPLSVGGKALNSWPSFVPITFECAVLLAAVAGVAGLFALNDLPSPHHPIFNAPRFASGRYFLCIEASDPGFGRASAFLDSLDPVEVTEVES
jgi:Ni/Fe-hydrogenase subunit HybB-like protein